MNPDFLKTFIIDESPEAIIETKSKDKLKVTFCGLDETHFASGYSMVFLYLVINQTKIDKEKSDFTNYVRFWRNRSGDLIASDGCQASKRCKHICAAYKIHRIGLDVGFISDKSGVKINGDKF